MKSIVEEKKLVSPYLLFFLMHSTQTGVGVLKFQSHIIEGAGRDSWISVFAFGLMLHIIFFMIVFILKQSDSGDILSFHKEVFGKIIGGLLNLVLACYFSFASLFTLHSYIDILQLWVFDGIHSWEFSLLFSIIIYYIVLGGFRIITAIAYWGVVIPSLLLLSLVYLLNYSEVSYILPLFNSELKDYVISARATAPTFLGFEAVLVFFPFIREREYSSKWGHLAIFYTTILYTTITIITLMFFSLGKLEHLTWPTLTMIKIIQFPFLERFEFIFIFTWLLVVMPVICIYLWSAIRSVKMTFPKVKQSFVLIGLLIVFHFVNSELIEMHFSYIMAQIIGTSGLVLLLCYIPLLFLIALVKKKMKNRATDLT
ncbi:spore germination protein (amino acid permease) [Gracilibacillus ureilyticus]|uniref:Spore germination protein (Amino acid permease) n=1 Tax=Gracilibacillus ureilyticus TaxID=531814 RepID=A0A1H9Q230_9BACI|nr:GerAB/ArcD/ProY family transporter [Gracilibacillus ureilyticus]SER54468.1 spore germination protein (amino acid permease) [Gracilibacillus ureilyticus]